MSRLLLNSEKRKQGIRRHYGAYNEKSSTLKFYFVFGFNEYL